MFSSCLFEHIEKSTFPDNQGTGKQDCFLLIHYYTQVFGGLCDPISQGGLGFDFFVNMSLSGMWLWLLENVPAD